MDMNNKSSKLIVMLFLGAAAGLCTAWLLRKRRQRMEGHLRPAGLPAKNVLLFAVCQRMLAARRGLAHAKILMEAIQRKYADLCLERPIPTSRAMRMHLYENILPGLALYRVLLAEYEGHPQAALAEVDEIFRAWTIEKVSKRFGAILSLPIPFWLFKLAADLQMKIYPAEGWEITYIEKSDTRLAFNMTRCFYLDTLKALDAPELTASFCKTDEVMAERFPGTVRFVRPHTLGRGDALCDFQYCRADRFIPGVPREQPATQEEAR
jgi:hypothetical protein